MGKPISNGIVELVDEKPSIDSNSWNCMDFWHFSGREEDNSWDASHTRFLAAKSGNCPYKDICQRYKRTIKKRSVQLTLNI